MDISNEAASARLDRATVVCALLVMFGELVYLASGLVAIRGAVLLAALGLTVASAYRFGLRELYLLTFCAVLAVIAFTTSPSPLGVLAAAFDQAIFLMAFILLIGLIQQAAQTSPAIRACGLYLTRQPSGRRYFSLFLGTHVMAQLFNLGVVSLLTPLVMQGSAANADDPLQPIREQRQLNAMLRGFAWCVIWSPTAVAPLVLMTLLPDAERGPWIGVGFMIAMIAMLLGWAEDRWSFRAIRRAIVAGAPRAAPPFPGGAFAQLALICLSLLLLVVLAMTLFDQSVVFGLMAASPIILLGWLLLQNQAAGRETLALTYGQISGIFRTFLPRSAPLAVTLAASGFIGRAAAVLMPVDSWAAALGVAAMPGWLFLTGLAVGVALLSQFALSPIMMAVFFGSLIAEIPDLPADVTWAALAISCGWALSMLISPFATVVLMMAQGSGNSGRTMTWAWNWRFTLIMILLLAAVFAVLTGGE